MKVFADYVISCKYYQNLKLYIEVYLKNFYKKVVIIMNKNKDSEIKSTIIINKWPNLDKRETKTALNRSIRSALIIYILSDGKKHKQKDIKKDFNSIYDEIVSENSVIDGNNGIPLIAGLDGLFGDFISKVVGSVALPISGKIDDGGVSRIVKQLAKKEIICREKIDGDRGASPVNNWLKDDPVAFLNILKLFKSFPSPWETWMFPSFSNYLIKSPYGKNTINQESIKSMVDSLNSGFNEKEEQIIRSMVQFSPSALFSLLDFCNTYGSKKGLKKIVFNDKRMRELLFGKLIFSVGDDLKTKWTPNEFSPIYPPHLQYTIKINLDKENLVDENSIETNYKVENNNLEIELKF